MRPMYLRGEWRPARTGGELAIDDPATGEPFDTVAYGAAEDAVDALDAAAEALPAWRALGPYARGRKLMDLAAWLRGAVEESARITTDESGKPLRDSRGEWSVAADLFDWYAEEAKRSYGRVIPARMPGRRLWTAAQPVGVVGVITAWNFPAYNPSRAVGAALAAGCTVVLRPSELTPLSALRLAEAAEAVGLPPGVLNVVNGDPEAVAGVMLASRACRKVSFTGSTRVGKELIRKSADTVTGLSLELGGNAPVVVCEDVDPEALAPQAVAARMRNAGQVCVAPQRFYVHESIYDRFLAAAAPRVAAMRLGPGRDAASEMGPLITRRHRDRVAGLVDDARGRGARLLAAADVPQQLSSGSFYAPTLVADAPADAPLWTEETFGPVLAVRPFADLDRVIDEANALEAGLAAYGFTRDLNRAHLLAERLEFGMVSINGWVPHATEAPFPGWKESGLGAESGPEGLAEYLETKLVSLAGLGG